MGSVALLIQISKKEFSWDAEIVLVKQFTRSGSLHSRVRLIILVICKCGPNIDDANCCLRMSLKNEFLQVRSAEAATPQIGGSPMQTSG